MINVGDYCNLTFLEFGLSITRMSRRTTFLIHLDLKIWNIPIGSMSRLFLKNDILLLRERDTDSPCRIMVSIQPADMTNQKKKSFQAQLGKKERANKKKAEQKAMKAMGKVQART